MSHSPRASAFCLREKSVSLRIGGIARFYARISRVHSSRVNCAREMT